MSPDRRRKHGSLKEDSSQVGELKYFTAQVVQNKSNTPIKKRISLIDLLQRQNNGCLVIHCGLTRGFIQQKCSSPPLGSIVRWDRTFECRTESRFRLMSPTFVLQELLGSQVACLAACLVACLVVCLVVCLVLENSWRILSSSTPWRWFKRTT